MEEKTLRYCLLPFHIIIILVHAIGLYLLLLVSRTHTTTQNLYLINLSTTEIVKNSIYLINTGLVVVNKRKHSDAYKHVMVDVEFTIASFTDFAYFLAMVLITGDRTASVIYDFRYRAYWDSSKVKTLIIATWCISFIMTSICVLIGVTKLLKDSTHNLLHAYVPTFLNIVFVVFAVVSYIYMFSRFAKGNRMRSNSTVSTSFDVFRNSRFYIATMLVASFVVFIVAPSLTLSILKICGIDVGR